MTDTALSAPSTDIPPIVLLVEDDRDTLDMYSTYFEMSGVWVARSTTPREAMAGVAELRPDAVITDLAFNGSDDECVELVHSLKTDLSTREIPVIVLSGQALPQIPAQTVTEADLCLVKPVLPDSLLGRLRELIARAHAVRVNCEQLQMKTTQVLQRAGELHLQAQKQAQALKAKQTVIAGQGRPCPQCGRQLEWIEKGRVGGADYDYYRWCRHGCGLYCFDRAVHQWLKLA
jgi:DNA-binding response OmpR family regulator